MAEKTKKGFNKKWLIALSVLVLAAIVTVMVLVFIPKDTAKAVKRAHQAENTMFLNVKNVEEDKKINEFMSKFGNETDYWWEALHVKTTALNLNIVLEFYNEYLPYAKSNKVFQDNYNKIMDGFDKAEKSQKKMNAILDEVNEKLDSSSLTYVRSAWRDFRIAWVDYMKGYGSAIEGMSHVFEGSMPEISAANKFSFLVLETVNDYIASITNAYEILVKNDLGDHLSTVTFTSGHGMHVCGKFVLFSQYLTNCDLSQYEYSLVMQETVEKVEKFHTVYKLSTQEVMAEARGLAVEIESWLLKIKDWGIAKSSLDTENLKETFENFLNGGLDL